MVTVKVLGIVVNYYMIKTSSRTSLSDEPTIVSVEYFNLLIAPIEGFITLIE